MQKSELKQWYSFAKKVQFTERLFFILERIGSLVNSEWYEEGVFVDLCEDELYDTVQANTVHATCYQLEQIMKGNNVFQIWELR